MTTDFEVWGKTSKHGFKVSSQVVCFGESCKYSPKDDNMYERLSNLGMHFIEVHSFKQDAYR